MPPSLFKPLRESAGIRGGQRQHPQAEWGEGEEAAVDQEKAGRMHAQRHSDPLTHRRWGSRTVAARFARAVVVEALMVWSRPLASSRPLLRRVAILVRTDMKEPGSSGQTPSH